MSHMADARVRAKRRKSPWNLLLIPTVLVPWFFLWWFSAVELASLHRLLHPGREYGFLPEGLSGILMAVAPLFAWSAPSMVVGNLLVAGIRPAKRALDAEGAFVAGADLVSSNRALLKVSAALTPAALLVGLLGAYAAW